MITTHHDEQRIALFIDFENIAIGVRDAHYRKFDINLVIERLLEKGKILSKKAYADWSRYSDYKRNFHEAAIELIEVPQKSLGGKNSADIRLVVDAMDMSFQKEHINCFVVASGDSDFSPLVSKLKENNKYVIGLGVKNSTSDLLIENCDEFIFYEDLVRGQQRPLPQIASLPEKTQECFALLIDSVLALQRENKEVLWGSMVKETMKRKKPSFNETYYGFRTFSHLLEDAQRRGIVTLRRDQKSGSYVVEDLGTAPAAAVRTGEGLGFVPSAVGASALPALGTTPLEGVSNGTPVNGEAPPIEAMGLRPAPRRRRGRGRRPPRSTSVLAAGANLEPEASDDDHDAAEDFHRDSPDAPDANTPSTESRPASPAPSASPGSGSPDPNRSADGERNPFSFFSWIRKDANTEEAAKEERPKPEGGE